MNPNENKHAIQAVFASLAAGDAQPYLDLMAEDISWTVMGTTQWSGTYRGKEDVLGRLLRPVRSLLSPIYKYELDSVLAEGDMLVAELRGENTTKQGEPYNNKYCWVCRMRDGKLKEVKEYLDTELVRTRLVEARGAAREQNVEARGAAREQTKA